MEMGPCVPSFIKQSRNKTKICRHFNSLHNVWPGAGLASTRGMHSLRVATTIIFTSLLLGACSTHLAVEDNAGLGDGINTCGSKHHQDNNKECWDAIRGYCHYIDSEGVCFSSCAQSGFLFEYTDEQGKPASRLLDQAEIDRTITSYLDVLRVNQRVPVNPNPSYCDLVRTEENRDIPEVLDLIIPNSSDCETFDLTRNVAVFAYPKSEGSSANTFSNSSGVKHVILHGQTRCDDITKETSNAVDSCLLERDNGHCALRDCRVHESVCEIDDAVGVTALLLSGYDSCEEAFGDNPWLKENNVFFPGRFEPKSLSYRETFENSYLNIDEDEFIERFGASCEDIKNRFVQTEKSKPEAPSSSTFESADGEQRSILPPKTEEWETSATSIDVWIEVMNISDSCNIAQHEPFFYSKGDIVTNEDGTCFALRDDTPRELSNPLFQLLPSASKSTFAWFDNKSDDRQSSKTRYGYEWTENGVTLTDDVSFVLGGDLVENQIDLTIESSAHIGELDCESITFRIEPL